MTRTPLTLLNPKLPPAPHEGPGLLLSRDLSLTRRDHGQQAPAYVPDDKLTAAINVALAVGQPLLLTGEPGTGKTQCAYYLGHYFQAPVFKLVVTSTAAAKDLWYDFDAVAYFHDAQVHGAPKPKLDYIKKNALWLAYDELKAGRPAVVLIDEIDKAPRDFPNDLLEALDQHQFWVPELATFITAPTHRPPPVVVITSNLERQLPPAFLRRCIFHHIELTPPLIELAVKAHGAQFKAVSEPLLQVALARFGQVRDKVRRKKPATAELLVWLTLLGLAPPDPAWLAQVPLPDLPHLGALVKDKDDLADL